LLLKQEMAKTQAKNSIVIASFHLQFIMSMKKVAIFGKNGPFGRENSAGQLRVKIAVAK
jgi:hypothetical protein